MSGDLSENFSRHEFFRFGQRDSGLQNVKFYQEIRLRILTLEILQPIRDAIGLPITITNGVRTAEDYTRLTKAGYYPSQTSDHFFGNPIPLPEGYKLGHYGSHFVLKMSLERY